MAALFSIGAVSAYAVFSPGLHASAEAQATGSDPLPVLVEVHALAGELPAGTTGGSTLVEGQDGVISLEVSTTSLSFGELEPGETSRPVAVTVKNAGAVAVKFAVSSTALAGPEGNSIPASRVSVSTNAESRGGSLGDAISFDKLALAPGASATFYFTLSVPSGEETYIPAGPYQGTLSLLATGVTA